MLPLLWLLWPQEVLDWHYDGHRLCHPAVQPLGRLWSLLLMPWHSHQWVGLVINLLLEVDNGDKRERQQTQQLLSYKVNSSWAHGTHSFGIIMANLDILDPLSIDRKMTPCRTKRN